MTEQTPAGPSRYFYDTEFLEDGKTIELISIGIVAEDGREFYAVNRDAPWKRIKKMPWLMANVWPNLPRYHGDARNHYGDRLNDLDPAMQTPLQIAGGVRGFLLGTEYPRRRPLPDIELWADYGAYDHVVLAQLFGTMVNLPDGIPMWTHDLRQHIQTTNAPIEVWDIPFEGQPHHALHDARHDRRVFQAIADWKGDVDA
jgi:hypothetical protein